MKAFATVSLAVLLSLWGGAEARAQGKFALKWADAPLGDPIAPGKRRVYLGTTGKLQDLKAPPPNVQGEVWYFTLPVCDTLVLAALEVSAPPKLYVDTDGTGDLSKAAPLPAGGPEGVSWFGPVTVSLRGVKEPARMRLSFWSDRPSGGQRHLAVVPGGYMVGEVTLAGKTYRVALVDNNLNGKYDKAASLTSDCDTLAIDVNQDGKFAYSPDELEILPLVDMIHIGDAYYRVDVGEEGRSLNLTKTEPALGTLDTGCPDLALSVVGDAGFHRLHGSGGKWRLAAGSYRTVQFALIRTDADGIPWTLPYYWGHFGGLANFEIRPGEVTVLRTGPPLASRLTVGKPNKGSIYMSFQPVGQAGEGYTVHADKEASSQAAPGVRILDEQGKVLTVDKFAYE